jgi:predicted nucleic acid-binding protein
MPGSRYLIDTNCWMAVARAREGAQVVQDLLAAVGTRRLLVTDFTLHSLGVVMQRHKMLAVFPVFMKQMKIGDEIEIVSIAPPALTNVVDVCRAHRLDFDDAYQYVAAELNDLKLVSLDSDFDRTPRGRLTPAAALKLFTDEQRKPQQEA